MECGLNDYEEHRVRLSYVGPLPEQETAIVNDVNSDYMILLHMKEKKKDSRLECVIILLRGKEKVEEHCSVQRPDLE